MRKTLEQLYEQTLINEVAGATNYWLTPKGQLVKVHNHMEYARKHFDDVDWDEFAKNILTLGWDHMYDAVYNAGYVRVVEEPTTFFVSYNRAKPPTREQFKILFGMSEDKEKNLYDDETGKLIVKQNEVDPTATPSFKQNALPDKETPSFYKNKPIGDSFSKFDLNDYTKIIYEYNVNDNIDNDPRQGLIEDAIDDIKMSNKGYTDFSVEDTIEYWKRTLSNKGFSNNEINDVISMGLGTFRNF